MSTRFDVPPDHPHELTLGRVLDAPRLAIWRCWTEPSLLVQWFCPPPWSVSEARLDVRPGGVSFVVMNGPNGEVVPNPGQYLEVVHGERLVFTDALVGDSHVSEGPPFMVGVIELADEPGGGTRYIARARHWSAETKKAHEEMGFHEGWSLVADQLEALARTL